MARSPAIGHNVRQESTGRIGYVVTYYENGDLMVRVERDPPERWLVADVYDLGRSR